MHCSNIRMSAPVAVQLIFTFARSAADPVPVANTPLAPEPLEFIVILENNPDHHEDFLTKGRFHPSGGSLKEFT